MRILVADDEAVIRLGLKAILESAGHTVVGTAPNGRQAVALAQQARPDMAVLDIQMPGVNGLDTARQIVAQRPTAVVLLTAFSQREYIAVATTSSVFAYLVKPVKEDALLPALDLAWNRFTDWGIARAAAAELKQDLETRDIVAQAKFALMEREGLKERQAFLRIHHAARTQRIPMRKVAEEILKE
jgi:response regulator NasT